MFNDISDIIVLIPVYKKSLNIYEKVSLAQVRRVLGVYDIYFIAPEFLNLDYGELSEGIPIKVFPGHFFESKFSYSELLLYGCLSSVVF